MTRVQREAVKVLVRKSSARAIWPRPSNTALQAACCSLNLSNTDRSNRFPPHYFKSKATGKGLPKPLPPSCPLHTSSRLPSPSIRVTHFFYVLAPLSPTLFAATTRDCRAPLRSSVQMTGVMHSVHPRVSLLMAASLMPQSTSILFKSRKCEILVSFSQ
jgi:hypothetical protein